MFKYPSFEENFSVKCDSPINKDKPAPPMVENKEIDYLNVRRKSITQQYSFDKQELTPQARKSSGQKLSVFAKEQK